MIAVDIETAPLETAEFDESTVKTGNLKDEKKIAAKIEEAREAFKTTAALHWPTARITCIGLAWENDSFDAYSSPNEHEILEYFWTNIKDERICTWNGYEFDIQIIIIRSIINGVAVPRKIRGRKYPAITDDHVDMMQMLTDCGKYVSLNTAAKTLLGKEKSGSGKDAIEYWNNGDIEKLKDYCMDDVKITMEIWKKIKDVY